MSRSVTALRRPQPPAEVKPEDVIDLTEYLFEEDEDAGREQEVTREELLEVILKIRGGRSGMKTSPASWFMN